MSKILKSISIISLLFLTSCTLFRNPLKRWDSAVTKLDNSKTAIQNNKDSLTEQASKYVYATGIALDADPNHSKYNSVAQSLNDKAQAVLGQPDLSDINQLRTMVANLLSTNQAIIIKGEKQLADMDAEVKDLQKERDELQAKLDASQSKLVQVGSENASMAEKWHKLVSWIYYVIYFLIGSVVFRIVAALLPPPYNTIVGLVAAPFGLVVKLIHGVIPEAKAFAGVVGKEYQTATTNLVQAVQELKTNHPDIHQQISTTVLKNTDTEAVAAINQAKTSIGFTS